MHARNLLAVLILSAASVVVLAPAPASADTPDCASRSEFGRIDKGMSVTRVSKILDVNGSQTGIIGGPRYDYTSRLYGKCGSVPALATVKYRRPDSGGTWRVTSKAWN